MTACNRRDSSGNGAGCSTSARGQTRMNRRPTPAARIVLLVSLSLVAASACSGEASRRDRVLRYYEASGVLDSIDRNFVAMVQQSRKMYAGYPAEFWAGHDAIFRQYKADLVDLYVDVALDELSDRELDELLADHYLEAERSPQMDAIRAMADVTRILDAQSGSVDDVHADRTRPQGPVAEPQARRSAGRTNGRALRRIHGPPRLARHRVRAAMTRRRRATIS